MGVNRQRVSLGHPTACCPHACGGGTDIAPEALFRGLVVPTHVGVNRGRQDARGVSTVGRWAASAARCGEDGRSGRLQPRRRRCPSRSSRGRCPESACPEFRLTSPEAQPPASPQRPYIATHDDQIASRPIAIAVPSTGCPRAVVFVDEQDPTGVLSPAPRRGRCRTLLAEVPAMAMAGSDRPRIAGPDSPRLANPWSSTASPSKMRARFEPF